MNSRPWLRRAEQEAGLEKELSFHIEERVAELIRSGVVEEGARRRGRPDFGGTEQVKDDCRDVRRARWVKRLGQDARYPCRNLRRNPGFAAIAIATLALGIAGITAMFIAFDMILIHPLPYAQADRIVMIWDQLDRERIRKSSSTPAEAALSGDSEPEQVPAPKTSWNFWSVLAGETPDRARLHGRRGREQDACAGDQLPTVPAALRRFARCVGPQDRGERSAVRNHRGHAARVLLHVRARHRDMDALFIPRLNAKGVSHDTTPRLSRG
jgi:hypothetical protein